MSKIRSSARGQDCQVRMPGICNRNSETVVLAHLGGGGMGMKQSDLHGAYCCSSCHDEADRRTHKVEAALARVWLLEGMVRTQKIMLETGLVQIKG